MVLLAATWLTHGISLFGDFVWDDVLFLECWLPRFDSLWKIFAPPGNIEYWPRSYYRPLGVLSLKLDYIMYGANPLGWHVTNLVLHSLICVQLFFLLLSIAKNVHASPRLVQLSSLLFAVHPIHVESVNWIAGRSDPLAAMFCLAAIQSSMLYGKNPRWFWLPVIGLSIFFGLLCKELAIAAIPLSLLTLLLIHQHGPKIAVRGKLWLLISVAFLIPVFTYALLRLSVSTSTGNVSHALTLEGCEKVVRSLAYYGLQFFLFRPQIVGPPARFAPSVGLSLMLVATALCLIVYGSYRRGWKLSIIDWGVIWFLITIAPSLLVPAFQLDSSFLYDRYLYLPSLGMGVALAAFALKHVPAILYGQAFTILLLIVASGGIIKANVTGSYWHDNVAIWEYTLKHAPEDFRSHTMLGLEYRRRGLRQQSLIEHQNALAKFAQSGNQSAEEYGLLVNVAVAAREAHNFALAETTADRAIKADADRPEAWLERGLAKLNLGDRQHAEASFSTALAIKPDSSEAHVNLAYLRPDGSKAQEELLIKAIWLDPRNAMAFNNLGILYAARRDLAKAIKCFETASMLDPKLTIARSNFEALRDAESHE